MLHTLWRRRSTAAYRRYRRLGTVAVATLLLAAPVTAHSTGEGAAEIAFPAVVVGSVVVSLLGGGLVLVALDRRPPVRRVVPLLVLVLGGLSVALALTELPTVAGLGAVGGVAVVALTRDHAVTDCGGCADAALGAVTLHRSVEGVVLATVYAADAALGLLGAAVLAVHAVAETAAVGSLYAASRRHAVAAVCLLQAGFVGGVVAGHAAVGAVPPAIEVGLLALVGGVLLAVGAREGYSRYTGRRSVPAA
jgi:hypothetical protein